MKPDCIAFDSAKGAATWIGSQRKKFPFWSRKSFLQSVEISLECLSEPKLPSGIRLVQVDSLTGAFHLDRNDPCQSFQELLRAGPVAIEIAVEMQSSKNGIARSASYRMGGLGPRGEVPMRHWFCDAWVQFDPGLPPSDVPASQAAYNQFFSALAIRAEAVRVGNSFDILPADGVEVRRAGLDEAKPVLRSISVQVSDSQPGESLSKLLQFIEDGGRPIGVRARLQMKSDDWLPHDCRSPKALLRFLNQAHLPLDQFRCHVRYRLESVAKPVVLEELAEISGAGSVGPVTFVFAGRNEEAFGEIDLVFENGRYEVSMKPGFTLGLGDYDEAKFERWLDRAGFPLRLKSKPRSDPAEEPKGEPAKPPPDARRSFSTVKDLVRWVDKVRPSFPFWRDTLRDSHARAQVTRTYPFSVSWPERVIFKNVESLAAQSEIDLFIDPNESVIRTLTRLVAKRNLRIRLGADRILPGQRHADHIAVALDGRGVDVSWATQRRDFGENRSFVTRLADALDIPVSVVERKVEGGGKTFDLIPSSATPAARIVRTQRDVRTSAPTAFEFAIAGADPLTILQRVSEFLRQEKSRAQGPMRLGMHFPDPPAGEPPRGDDDFQALNAAALPIQRADLNLLCTVGNVRDVGAIQELDEIDRRAIPSTLIIAKVVLKPGLHGQVIVEVKRKAFDVAISGRSESGDEEPFWRGLAKLPLAASLRATAV